MLHVFVDTNIFLSLYAYTDDNIDELKKLITLINGDQLKVYITTVLNQEFHRNRDQKISESLGNLEKFSANLSIPRFAEHHPEAAQLRELLKEVTSVRKTLVDKAKEEIAAQQLAADKLFVELRDTSKMTAISKAADEAARVRLERGNPPGKDGSLGDRWNWEALLEAVPKGSDIHIVSRDKDFASTLGANIPNSFLRGEWATLKKAKMFLYNGLKPFIKEHFPDISLSSDAEKKVSILALTKATSFQKTHTAISKLSPFLPDFTNEEAHDLFKALISNYEIHAIATDDDVRSFYQDLLVAHWAVLSSEEYEQVTEYVDDVPF